MPVVEVTPSMGMPSYGNLVPQPGGAHPVENTRNEWGIERRGEMMKFHYFDQDQADSSDMLLGMAKMQGYVPETCLLGGATVMHEVKRNEDPCAGCNGPREKCKGRTKTPWPSATGDFCMEG